MNNVFLTAPPFAMSDIITNITTLVTGFLGWVSQTVSTITGDPFLLFCALVPFATVGITVVKRLMHVRA
jgi:uncharacterized membrane-anchored protein